MRIDRYTDRDYAFSKRLIEVEQEFINRFFEDDTTEKEKVLLVLKSCEANIHPSSRNARYGYKKYIKKAIKLLEKLNDGDFE